MKLSDTLAAPLRLPAVGGRLLILLLLCGVLGACSNTFLYNQLDWLVPWYVDDYVDLTREQKKTFKQQLRPLLAWHRAEELDSYLQILAHIETDLQQPVTAATVAGWSKDIVLAYRRLEQRGLPLAFELAEQLSPAQISEFIAGLYAEQEEFEEEYLPRTDAEVYENSYENFSDSLVDVLGRLQSGQKERLRQAAQALQRFDGHWLQQRRWWLEQTAELLEREPGWQQRAVQLVEQREQLEAPEYQRVNEHNKQLIYTVVAETLNSRTEKQDQRLHREIKDIRRDLQKLISQQR